MKEYLVEPFDLGYGGHADLVLDGTNDVDQIKKLCDSIEEPSLIRFMEGTYLFNKILDLCEIKHSLKFKAVGNANIVLFDRNVVGVCSKLDDKDDFVVAARCKANKDFILDGFTFMNLTDYILRLQKKNGDIS